MLKLPENILNTPIAWPARPLDEASSIVILVKIGMSIVKYGNLSPIEVAMVEMLASRPNLFDAVKKLAEDHREAMSAALPEEMFTLIDATAREMHNDFNTAAIEELKKEISDAMLHAVGQKNQTDVLH